MADPYDFEIRYWGTTGTISRPLSPRCVTEKVVSSLMYLRDSNQLHRLQDKELSFEQLVDVIRQHVPFHLRSTYGGNTSCIQVQTPDALLIVDAGSGLRQLGVHLNRLWNSPNYTGPREAHVLITHSHMDHTFATAFTDPYYDSANNFTIWAPQNVLDSLTVVLGAHSKLRSIYFPINFDQMGGIKKLVPIAVDKPFEIEGTRIHTCALNHPGGCVGYRFQRGSRSIVFASDHEQIESPDPTLVHFARHADLLYADAQYRQVEYDGIEGIAGEAAVCRRGWGHSTVEASIRTAASAGVKRLHLGHHDPKRSDEELAAIEIEANQQMHESLAADGRAFRTCLVKIAREEMVVRI